MLYARAAAGSRRAGAPVRVRPAWDRRVVFPRTGSSRSCCNGSPTVSAVLDTASSSSATLIGHEIGASVALGSSRPHSERGQPTRCSSTYLLRQRVVARGHGRLAGAHHPVIMACDRDAGEELLQAVAPSRAKYPRSARRTRDRRAGSARARNGGPHLERDLRDVTEAFGCATPARRAHTHPRAPPCRQPGRSRGGARGRTPAERAPRPAPRRRLRAVRGATWMRCSPRLRRIRRGRAPLAPRPIGACWRWRRSRTWSIPRNRRAHRRRDVARPARPARRDPRALLGRHGRHARQDHRRRHPRALR